MLHSDLEVSALAQEIEECGIPFGKIDPKPAGPRAPLTVL
jgi:hypothetical protein